MKTTIRRALITTVCAAVAFLVGLVLFALWRESQTPTTTQLEYSKLYLEAFKVIVVSFFVALVGVLLPALSSETRYSFERLKESRIAYSEAKTSLNYLPIRLCTLPFAEASALLQQTHFHKHQAELYEELKRHLAHSGKSPQQWGDEAYYRLIGYRGALEEHASKWESLNSAERLKYLLESRTALDKDFPPPSIADDRSA